jgi:DNA-binding NtrC family response regulator
MEAEVQMKRPTILYAAREGELRRNLRSHLLSQEFQLSEASDCQHLLKSLREKNPDLIILGTSLDGNGDGLGVARSIREWEPRIPIILITKTSSEEQAIAALRIGINDYFKLPFSFDLLTLSIRRLLASPFCKESLARSHPPIPGDSQGRKMIGESPRMREIKTYLQKVASTDANILITGETGTGKELAAELVHRYSRRRQKNLVSINCAALPDSLLESELFGYEKGAFTGACSSYAGKLMAADGGTVFFDEIGDMSTFSQTKILRVIENKECYRLGGNRSTPMNFRIIAATNQDLERLVSEDKFRKDLYFRFNVVRVHLPALRERQEDIPLLVNHFLKGFSSRLERDVEGLTPEALGCLQRYDWPGNVRELKNLLEAICIDLSWSRISAKDLPEHLSGPGGDQKTVTLDERDLLLSTLASTNWNKSEAAKALCWSRMTLYRKMAKYKISEDRSAKRLENILESVTTQPLL